MRTHILVKNKLEHDLVLEYLKASGFKWLPTTIPTYKFLKEHYRNEEFYFVMNGVISYTKFPLDHENIIDAKKIIRKHLVNKNIALSFVITG